MGVTWEDGGYSADIRIHLTSEGRRYEVAEIGPDSLTLRNADQLPAGHAQIVIEVDGQRETRDVIVSCRDASMSELAYS